MKTNKKDVKISDDKIDEIIETVLGFVDCEHDMDREEDGVHLSTFYCVLQGCEEAVREVLNDTSK